MIALVHEDSMAELISACSELPDIVLPADALDAWPAGRALADAAPGPEWDVTVAAIAHAASARDWHPADDR